MAGFTLSVSGRTFALIGSNSVDTVSSRTQPWNGLTLINILARSAADIGDEAATAGVWLGGAHLAGVSPGSTNGSAAKSLGANDPAELSLAHLIVDLGEAWSCTVVSLALRASETVDTGTSVGSDTTTSVLTSALTHRLSAVVAGVAFLTGAVVFLAAPTIHTADVTGLNSDSGTTVGRELSTGTGAHIGSGAETITTGVPTDRDDTLVSPGKGLPSWATVRMEPGTTHIGPSKRLLPPPPNSRDLSLVNLPGETAGLVASVPRLPQCNVGSRPAHRHPAQKHLGYHPCSHWTVWRRLFSDWLFPMCVYVHPVPPRGLGRQQGCDVTG